MRNDSTDKRIVRQSGAMLLALIALLLAPVSPAAAAAIAGIAVDDGGITVTFDGAAADVRAFVLDSPARLVLDLAGIDGGAPAAAPGGIVLRTRTGKAADGTRLVFDLAAPIAVAEAALAPDRSSYRLAFAGARDLGAGARAGAGTAAPAMALDQPNFGGSVSTPIAPAQPYALPIPPVAGRADKPLVVIDAGHGGHDPGSMSETGRREKDATLAIAKAIRDELLASGRVRVALTRSDDRFLTLGERPAIARKLGADLFISVHADSAPGSGARGATVYTLSEVASDRVAARLAAKENRADIINGVDLGGQNGDVSSILIDLTQRETMNASSRFADLLQHELTDAGVTFKTTFHRFAGLAVLKAPDVPAVLLETGYMSSPDDLDLLFSKAYQHELAVGVTRAVETHFARRTGRMDVASRD